MGKKKFKKPSEGGASGEQPQPSHPPQQQAEPSTSGTQPPTQQKDKRAPPDQGGGSQQPRQQPQGQQQARGSSETEGRGPLQAQQHQQGGQQQQRGPQDQGRGQPQAGRQQQQGQQQSAGPQGQQQQRGPQGQQQQRGPQGQQQQRGPQGQQQQRGPQGQQQQRGPQDQRFPPGYDQGRGQPEVRQQQQQQRGPQDQRFPPGHDQGRGQPEVWQQEQQRGQQQFRGPHDQGRGPPQDRQHQQGQPQAWGQQQGQKQPDQGRGQAQASGQKQFQQQQRGPQDQRFPPGHDQGRGQQQGQQQHRGQQQRGSQDQRSEQGRGPPQGGQQAGYEQPIPRGPQQPRGGKDQRQPERTDSEESATPTTTPSESPKKDQTRQERGDQRKPEPSKQTPAQPPAQRASAKPSTPDSPGLDLAIPQRMKLNTAGTEGHRIRIETNHLLLTLKGLKIAYHYDVTVDPDTPKKLLRVAVESFRCKHYPKNYPAFDGKKNLYSAKELPLKLPFTDEVAVREDDREKKFKVTIKFAATVDLTTVAQYFEAVTTNRHLLTPQDAIQCLDIVLRSAPSLNCIPVGRSFFTLPRGNIIDLGDGMEMYYGYYQSAILGWKPFLNVDVSHKAFPKSLNVLDVIKELCPRNDLSNPMNSYDKDTVNKFLRTLKVQYEIPNLPATRRVMRINELDKPASEAKFKLDDGRQMTVEQYFQVEKKVRLRYPNLPCLWVGSKQREQRILIPPELCVVMSGQVTNRTMTPTQTSNMIRYAATSTSVRKEKIMHSVTQARYNDDPSVREFGFSVSNNFTQLEARVLEPPTIQYNQRNEKVTKGVWRAQRFLEGKHLDSEWAIIAVDGRTNEAGLRDFTDMLMRSARDVGMDITQPKILQSQSLPPRREKEKLEQIFKNCKGLRLVIVVIPNDYKDIYNYVKQVAELIVGTLTQCIKAKNVFRPKPATVGNILLKINAKLNGVNHALGVRPKVLERPCMIMGADVTHPSPESRGTVPSVAAVTASHDSKAFKYNICWRLQPPTQEIISDLANIVEEHLMFFYRSNNQMKPERIIFFRDGVSEGQFEIVLNSEVRAIRQACTKVGDGSYKPKITFLVVQKRHHTRFFPLNPRDSEDRNCNVPAGTVVDTEITHPTALDFYLVSHASIQGVARPTKYRMLWDDNDMNENELERLTYHLCHLFTRCTRSVSYPAPTYYAHLAAARAKVYCERKILNMDNLEREFRSLNIKDDIVKQLPMFFV